MTTVLTQNGHYTHFDINKLPRLNVKFDEKMGYHWPNPKSPPKEIENTRVIINIDGLVGAYCRVCDAYKPYDIFSRDMARKYGIRPYCMPCYNRLEKERLSGANGNGNGNGAVSHTANGHVAQPTAVMSAEKAADKAYSLQMLEEIWVNAEHSKDVSFDMLTKLGIADEMKIIYITRWFNICDELRKKIDEQIGENIELYYVGQTNGKTPSYNGSGSNVDKLNALVKNYPDVKEEVRIIKLTNIQDTDNAEYEKIKETGAIEFGLNKVDGSSSARLIEIKYHLDPSIPNELDFHQSLVARSKKSGISKEELAKASGINGDATFHMWLDAMEHANNIGELTPFSRWHKVVQH